MLRALGGLLLLLAVPALWPLPAVAAQAEEYRLVIAGNSFLSSEQLRQAAAEDLAKLGQSDYPAATADDAAFQMTQAYRREGYAFAEVTYRFGQDEKPRRLEFTVHEGPLVHVEKIEFSGNTAFRREELLAFFEEEKRGLLGLGRLRFVETEVRQALGAIRDLYLGEGYPRVEIGEPLFTFSGDRRRVSILCTIQDGPRRTIAAVEFHGESDPAVRKKLAALPRELVGRPYVPRRKLLLKSRVHEIYGNLGYADAEVAVTEKSGVDFTRVRLEVSVVSGQPVKIAAIEISGNERTMEAFIRERLTLKAGELYTLAEKQRSFRRLYQTGLFSRVSIELGEGGGDRTVQVSVQEVPASEVFFQGGWGSYEMLRGSVGYRNSNIWGSGRIFRLEGGGSVKSAHLQANVTDPWFLGSDITADLPLYYRRRDEPSFTREEVGGSLLFSRNFSREVAVTLGYLYRRNNITDTTAILVPDSEANNYTTASVKLQAVSDSRNDIFFPSSGHKGFAALEVADPGLGSSLAFYRINLGIRKFLPFGEKNILALRFDTGCILPGRDQVSIPIGERFFNGGENTVRSFEESQLGPLDVLGEPLGGNAFNVAAVEWRRRLGGNLAVSIFFDYGNVSPNRSREEAGLSPFAERSEVIDATFADYFSGFRPGLGCGLLYLLPVGPARLDVGWNPDQDKARGEQEYAVHLSIGTAF